VDQDIEGIVDNARFCGSKILQKIEVRSTIRAKGYQFAVDDCVIWEITQCDRDRDVGSTGRERYRQNITRMRGLTAIHPFAVRNLPKPVR
jgi:hypothetical protein